MVVVVVVVVVVEEEEVEVETEELMVVEEEVEVVEDEGNGTAGSGQVVSFVSSGQNSLILWYRYHCLASESPDGKSSSGSSVGVGVQSCFRRLKATSGASDFARTNTCPLLRLEKRMW